MRLRIYTNETIDTLIAKRLYIVKSNSLGKPLFDFFEMGVGVPQNVLFVQNLFHTWSPSLILTAK